MPGSSPARRQIDLRKLTIAGERAMAEAEEEARAILDEHENEILRSYAASGLLLAALDALKGAAARENAAQSLRAALLAMDEMPS
jgi:hypothetical protein